MWPTVRSRLPACFSESFRASLCLGDAEKKNNKLKDASLENANCIVQPEPSASIGINFAAAASSLRETQLPLRYVSPYTTTSLSEAVTIADDAHDVVAETPRNKASGISHSPVTSCSRTTPRLPTLKQKGASNEDTETKSRRRSRSISSEDEDEQEVKYSKTLEFLLKTNFDVNPKASSQEIVNDSVQSVSTPSTSSRRRETSTRHKQQLGLQDLLTANTQPQPSQPARSRSRKSTSQREIRKARRRELNKIHAKNYREKIKAEKECVSTTLSDLEERNAELKKKIREMEEKKQWLTSYINMATKKKTEELKAEQLRKEEEERKKREEEERLSLDIEELFGSILSSQSSFSAYEVMDLE